MKRYTELKADIYEFLTDPDEEFGDQLRRALLALLSSVPEDYRYNIFVNQIRNIYTAMWSN